MIKPTSSITNEMSALISSVSEADDRLKLKRIIQRRWLREPDLVVFEYAFDDTFIVTAVLEKYLNLRTIGSIMALFAFDRLAHIPLLSQSAPQSFSLC